jgi:hypothetical protein
LGNGCANALPAAGNDRNLSGELFLDSWHD